MSTRFLTVQDGDYRLVVKPGGTITLDTPAFDPNDTTSVGTVVITGNLLVQGTQTTINTQILEVQDNIIVLNRGDTGAGITSVKSGIEINRGSFEDVELVFDESITWTDPGDDENPDIDPAIRSGAFVFRVAGSTNNLIGIRTNSISTGGGDLNLLGFGDQGGTINVRGTVNYENRIIDDDDIPNKAYVDNAVLGNIGIRKISSGILTETAVEVFDFETTGLDSKTEVRINGIPTTTFFENNVEVQGVKFTSSTISPVSTSDNLLLTHSANTSVLINNVLEVRSLPNPLVTPTAPTNGVKIYTGIQSIGGTGIYFVNQDQTRDELVSRSKSILYGIIF